MLHSFRINCSFRVLVILLTMLLATWLAMRGTYWFSVGILASLIIIQTFDLIRYVEKTNIRISRLIGAIENEDFSLQFYEDRKGEAFKELVQTLNGVVQRFGEARKGREEAVLFLQTLMDHSPVAILVYDRLGNLVFRNRSLTQMLECPKLEHIDDLLPQYEELQKVLKELGHEESKSMRLRKAGGLENISVRAARFGLFGQVLTLVSLQNIYSELEAKELESWQKLMRVLTHEIMNSVTPIVSLASTADSLLAKSDFREKEELRKAIQTIHRRGEGLMAFTQAYRSVNRHPEVRIRRIILESCLENMRPLLETKASESGVKIAWQTHGQLTIDADPALLEQVIINIVLNAIEALAIAGEKQIRIESVRKEDQVILSILDTGPGIPPENLDKIFVPFFTTKKEGSGVGLSISRQLLRLMGAGISISSPGEKGTLVKLYFPVTVTRQP